MLFNFEKSETEAVDVFKKKLLALPELESPQSNSQHTTDSDPSNTKLESPLSQEHERNVPKPIGYLSTSTCDAKRHYNTSDKEFSAVVWAVLMLRLYLEGLRVTLGTEHQAPRCTIDLKTSTE